MVNVSTTRVSPSSILINVLILKYLVLYFNISGCSAARFFFWQKRPFNPNLGGGG